MISGLMIGGFFKLAAIMVLLGIVYKLKDRDYSSDTSRLRVQPWDLTAAYKVYIPVQLSIFVLYIVIQMLFLSSYPRRFLLLISSAMSFIPLLIILLLFLLIIKRPLNVRWNSFGINLEAFVKKAIPFIGILIAIYYIYAMLRGYKIISNLSGIKILLLTSIALMSLAEELLFRGILWSAFMRKMNVTMAALISSACWSFWHYHYSFLENVGMILIGLVLSWTYYRSRTILVPMAIHLVTNMMKILIQFPK